MSADKEFRKCIFTGIFALLGSRFIRNLSFTGTPCKLLLNTIKRVPVDDRRMMICNQIHGSFAVVFHNLFGNAVRCKCLLQKCIAYIFFVFQNALNQRLIPDFPACCGRQTLAFKSIFYACETVSVEE